MVKIIVKAFKVCYHDILYTFSKIQKWCILSIVLVFLHMYTYDICFFAEQLGLRINFWFFPFIMSTRIVRFVVILCYILLVCDCPFLFRQSMQVIIRSGRKAFYLGKIMYLAFLSILYFAFIAAAIPVMHLNNLSYSSDWGKVFGTIANGGIGNYMPYSINVSGLIVNQFLPIPSMCNAFLLSVMMGILIGLIICVSNSLFENKIAGTLLCGMFALLDFLLQTMDYLRKGIITYFSIFTWSDIRFIDYRGNMPYPSLAYILFMYSMGICLLGIFIITVQSKRDILM